jgi:hypothetical protein
MAQMKKLTVLLMTLLISLSLVSCDLFDFEQSSRSKTPAYTSHSAAAETAAVESSSAPAKLSDKEFISYFTHIACYSEYGTDDAGYIKRWEQTIKVQLHGNPTEEDTAILKDYIAKLNDIFNMRQIKIVKSGGNLHVYFVEQSKLKKYIPYYVEGNTGFTGMKWNSKKQLTKVYVGIATDTTTQEKRHYLILHEFTHALGPLNDSTVNASILSGIKTELGEMDWRAIEFLYSKFAYAGMSKTRVEEALDSWLFVNLS